MAASKPTSSLSKYLHILSTKRYLGTLAADLGCFPLDRAAYPTRTASQATFYGIRSLIEFGNLVRPLVQSVLYHHNDSSEAIPKDISARTSYHGI